MTSKIIEQKRNRITKLRKVIASLKEDNQEIDKNRLTSILIVEHGISKKTAIEEIEAVINYEFN